VRGAAFALVLSLSTAVCGAAHAQQEAADSSQVRTFRAVSLDGEVTLRVAQAGDVTAAEERPTVVMFLDPTEAQALTDGLNRCGADQEACGFAAPAHRVTVVAIDPAEVTRLAARRPDPAAATAEFLADDLPEWLFAEIEPDDTLLIAGGVEGVDALRGALRRPGAYDALLLLEPDLRPDVALPLIATIPPFGGETTNIDIYADPWSPGEDLAAETLVNALVEGPYYVDWITPDDQRVDPDAARREVAVDLIWRMAAIPPW